MAMSTESVSIVIPGQNCAATIGDCLAAVVPMMGETPLGEIILVDDGSTDNTAEIIADYPVKSVRGEGRGAGRVNKQWD